MISPLKTFAEWALDHAPPWLADPVGELYVQFLGFVEDLTVESAVQAVKASKMTADTFHPSGLRYIGEERMMPRYPSETDEEYRARLLGAWDAWRESGTWVAIVEQLAAYGVTAEVWVQGYPGPLPASAGAPWDWDDDLLNAAASRNWARFFVVITSHPWSTWDWAETDMVYGGGQTWGSDATTSEVTAVREIIKHWRPARMVFPHVLVEITGAPSTPTTGDLWNDVQNRPAGEYLFWDGYGVRAY